MKIERSTSFLSYGTNNKNEIKGSSRIRMKAKEPSWNWNMKDNVMARYCYNSSFLQGDVLEQCKGFQITLKSWVQFSEPVAKTYFLPCSFLDHPT